MRVMNPMASLSTTPRRLVAALLVMAVAGVVALLGVRVVSALLSGTTASSSNSYTATSCFPSIPVPVSAGDGGNVFAPQSVTVHVGCSVTWTVPGSSQHNTRSLAPNAGLWSSANLKNGGAFNQTFNSTGTFNYECSIHNGGGNGMNGTITVIA